MTKRWKERPPGSTWGDWGDDDELGRINLVTPEKVLEGAREVQAGISFCLSLPLDFPGGTALNQRRYPPILAPTEDMEGNVDTIEIHVLKDLFGIAFWHPTTRLAVTRDGPALESRSVQAAKDPGPTFNERLDLEVLFPHGAIPQMLRKTGDEQVGRLEEMPVGGDDEWLPRHWLRTSPC